MSTSGRRLARSSPPARASRAARSRTPPRIINIVITTITTAIITNIIIMYVCIHIIVITIIVSRTGPRGAARSGRARPAALSAAVRTGGANLFI